MQAVRTVIWVLLLVALGIFSFANWSEVEVRIWDGLVLDTMLPAVIILSFAIGFVPMWLYYRTTKWQLDRKIASLETAARSIAPHHAPDNVPPSAPAPAPPAKSETVAEPVALTPETKAPDA
jgi:putative membrane protein